MGCALLTFSHKPLRLFPQTRELFHGPRHLSLVTRHPIIIGLPANKKGGLTGFWNREQIEDALNGPKGNLSAQPMLYKVKL